VPQAKKLKVLEHENARLKKRVTDPAFEKAILEVARKRKY
jgi:hypothetical protein